MNTPENEKKNNESSDQPKIAMPDRPFPGSRPPELPVPAAPEASAEPPAAPTTDQQPPGASPAVLRNPNDAILRATVGSVGRVELLTDQEQMELLACEEVIKDGWSSSVQMGLAFGRIQKGNLCRVDFDNFESYCRLKWHYGRHYVYRLIAAAQVFSQLLTNRQQRMPEYEFQVRPLVGLTPDQACQVWDFAVEKAGQRRITAAIIRGAMNHLQIGPPPNPKSSQARVNTLELRARIDQAVGELLVLISQRVDYQVLTQKVEALHGHFRALFPPKRPPGLDAQTNGHENN